MKKVLKISISVILFAGLLYVSFFISPAEEINKKAEVKISNDVISAEVVLEKQDQEAGLSNRASLGEDQGMLFVFPEKDFRFFWMKDMNFPIDIVWISGNEIVGVERNAEAPDPATPDDELEIYSSPSLVDKVLEINAGRFDQIGADIGDEIEIYPTSTIEEVFQ